MDLMHEIAQKVEDQLDVQYHNNFSPTHVTFLPFYKDFNFVTE